MNSQAEKTNSQESFKDTFQDHRILLTTMKKVLPKPDTVNNVSDNYQ